MHENIGIYDGKQGLNDEQIEGQGLDLKLMKIYEGHLWYHGGHISFEWQHWNLLDKIKAPW